MVNGENQLPITVTRYTPVLCSKNATMRWYLGMLLFVDNCAGILYIHKTSAVWYDQCILVEDIGKFFSLFIAGTEEPFTARTVHVYVHIYNVEKTFIISDHAAWDTYIYVVLCSQAISAVLEMWLVSWWCLLQTCTWCCLWECCRTYHLEISLSMALNWFCSPRFCQFYWRVVIH